MTKTNCRIDLHIHSAASDGTDSPAALLEKIKAAGIGIFALTDHDTISGALEMQKLISGDLVFVKGIEFSCITAAGKCHILGYNYDETAPAFRAILEEGKAKRQRKLERRIEFLKENFGIELSPEELAKLRGLNSVGNPHIARLVVARGYAADISEAIQKYLKPCKTEQSRVDGVAAIQAILAAGGTPVWAHPLGGTGEKLLTEEKYAEQLALLKAAGLMGLECYYSRYSAEQVRFLLARAEKNGLYISGGSDYHGLNKAVQLGELNAFGEVVTSERITLPILG